MTVHLRTADLRPYRARLWRMVEGQHRISTNRLADDPADQARLEELAEQVKPDVPAEARHLHWLLASPFRYYWVRASRFRRAGERPGIFYGGESELCALAEAAHGRLRFFADSPDSLLPRTTIEHTVFTAQASAEQTADLTAPPLDKAEAAWTHPDDYAACQDLAASARKLHAGFIRYWSVRAQQLTWADAACVAVLDPAALKGEPSIERTWHFRFAGEVLTAQPEFPASEQYRFAFADFGLAR